MHNSFIGVTEIMQVEIHRPKLGHGNRTHVAIRLAVYPEVTSCNSKNARRVSHNNEEKQTSDD